ncbi:MAG TPA: NUDIX hydrolase [Cyclobacteriaceae bacterium]|nr:NUDIX hydrolase [Cyclobacteriaceae bacterium]
MPAADRIEGLNAYLTAHEDELPFRDRFCELLESERCFHRDHLPGHITGSAWILNKKRTHVLLVHHVKLNKWLQPGGHADGAEDVLGVALREVNEETGLVHFKELVPGIFDLDIHTIPARSDFPEHSHYDVRFAFVATDDDVDLEGNEESHDVKWIPLSEVPERCGNNASILRMLEKTSAIV